MKCYRDDLLYFFRMGFQDHPNIFYYMKDWLETIDDYLKMTRRDILTTKGRVTHKQALEKAHGEYDKYRKKQEDILSPVECHFLESIEELQGLEDKK